MKQDTSNTIKQPLSFEAWCYETDIESKYQAFHDEYGDSACLLSDYKYYHYQEYLKEHYRLTD